MELVPRAGYDEDHATFGDSVRRFVADHVADHLDGWRAAGRFDRELFRSAGEQGFLGTSVPERFGGAEVDDPRFPAVLVEELAAAGATGLALVAARQLGVVVPVLTALADDDDTVAGWLAGLAEGELVGCVGLCGEDGTAHAVPGAAVADVFVLVGPDGDVRVANRDGVDVVPVPMLGGAEAAVGDVTTNLHTSVDEQAHFGRPTREVRRPNPAGSSTEPCLFVGARMDLWTAVVSVAAARAALDLTSAYVQERAVFGKQLSSFENTRFRLAEHGAELAAVQQLLDRALSDLADGELAPALAAAVRIVAERVHDQAVDQGMQLHGGYGYMREYPISHAFGDARFVRVVSAAGSEPRSVLATSLGL